MPCKYFLNGKELSNKELDQFMNSIPHEEKLKLAPDIAKNSYSSISWTPGEAQTTNPAKWISDIGYEKRGDIYNITVWNKRGNQVFQNQSADIATIEQTLGKDIAKEIQNGSGVDQGNNLKYLTNIDKLVGGNHKFYDEMLVNKANALGKKYGAKVEQQEINQNHDASYNTPFESRSKAEDVLENGGEIYAVNKNGQENLARSIKELQELETDGYGPFVSYILGDRQPKQSVHVLPITPALREAALNRGFPLFSAGLPVYTPVEHDPFAKKTPTLTKVDYDPFETAASKNYKREKRAVKYHRMPVNFDPWKT